MHEYLANVYYKKGLNIVNSDRCYVYSSKRRYLDFISGVVFNSLGYNNKKIISTCSKQLKKMIHPSNYYCSQPQINLAKRLKRLTGLDSVFFANSGTEANEAAIKFLTLVAEERGRKTILTIKGSFFGRTYGSQILKNGGKLYNLEVKSIEFQDLKNIESYVNSDTLVIYIELILGHGGILPIPEEIILKIKSICTKHNIILAIDEIQTGLGRCGYSLLYKKYRLNPSIVTLGKFFGGGFPLSAVIISKEISDRLYPGFYGSTMGGNSIACEAAQITLDYASNKNNLKRIINYGKLIKKEILSLQNRNIIDVVGAGLLLGIIINPRIDASKIEKDLFDNGLIVDVVSNNTIRLAPPLIINKKEINEALRIIKLVISYYGA